MDHAAFDTHTSYIGSINGPKLPLVFEVQQKSHDLTTEGCPQSDWQNNSIIEKVYYAILFVTRYSESNFFFCFLSFLYIELSLRVKVESFELYYCTCSLHGKHTIRFPILHQICLHKI